MTCAKRRVRCSIVTLEGEAFTGENSCDTPQPACPREEGEGYEKCRTVCHQPDHAEIAALRAALRVGADVRGGVAMIAGHYRMCESCEGTLRAHGITNFLFGVEDLDRPIPAAALPRSMYQGRFAEGRGPGTAEPRPQIDVEAALKEIEAARVRPGAVIPITTPDAAALPGWLWWWRTWRTRKHYRDDEVDATTWFQRIQREKGRL